MQLKEWLKKSKLMCFIYQFIVYVCRQCNYVYFKVMYRNLWLTTDDLMTPVDGEMTFLQAMVCTRILDLKSVLKGGVADNSLDVHKNVNDPKAYNESIENQTLWWKENYISLVKYGFNPTISKINCCSKYVTIGQGTHRMACLAFTDQKYVPIIFSEKWGSREFIPEEYLYNKEQYRLLEKIREQYYPRTMDYRVLGFCKKQHAKLVQDSCNMIGLYEELYTVRVKWNKNKTPQTNLLNGKAIKLLKKLENENLLIFCVHLDRQKMICKYRHIQSVYVNKVNSLINNMGYISGTLMESDNLDILLNHCTKKI